MRIHDGRVIALERKTVGGARTATTSAPHLSVALDHTTGIVAGPIQVAAKTRETPAVQELLASFGLTGVVVTEDAMHTQTDTATAITSAGAGGVYVFTLKGNTLTTLHRQLQTLPWKDVLAHSRTVTSQRRRATRTVRVLTAWPGGGVPPHYQQAQRSRNRQRHPASASSHVVSSSVSSAARSSKA